MQAVARPIARWIRVLEWMAVLLVAACALALHLRFIQHVGGLWRDEANSVNLATVPSLGEMWRSLDYDSFPVLYFLVLRGWTGIFGADNDFALRALGLVFGLGVLEILWANARAFGARLPVLSFALLGLNPMFIRYGDSNRAFGLGIVLILLAFGNFWRLVQAPGGPSRKQIGLAAVSALLAVHCLYYNAVLLFAIALGALAVAARTRAWRTAIIILSIGFVAAVSLLPYVPMMIRMRHWTFLVKTLPCDFAGLWERAGDVLGSPISGSIWIWSGLVLGGGVFVPGYVFLNRARAKIPAAVLFGTVALFASLASYMVFLRVLGYLTQPWYYITIVAFAAASLEMVFGAWPALPNLARLPRPLIAIVLLGLSAQEAWAQLTIRHTNADLAAREIQARSSKGDLIFFPVWNEAISFLRYYHGEAEVATVPPISDLRFHRYDLVLEQMMTEDANRPNLARIEETLRSGHRVFLANELISPEPGQTLAKLHPAYQDETGKWQGSPYYLVWQQEAGRLIREHATAGGHIAIPLPEGESVQDYEELSPSVVQGWK